MAKRYLGVARDLNNTNLLNVADPTAATHGANKQYVDNRVDGLAYKEEVRGATTANIAIASALANGASIDGLTTVTGDRWLVKVQTDPKENGIYIVPASGAATRATDANSTADLNNATVYVTEGTTLGGTEWTQTTKNPLIATDNIVFAQKTTGTAYTASLGVTLSGSDFRLAAGAAGNALTLTSGVLDVVPGTNLEISSDTIRIAATAAGGGLTGGGASVLAVGAGNGITVNADDVALASTAAGAGLTYTTGVLAVVATSGGGLTVNADDVGVDSTVSRRFSIATHASTTSIAITHSLGVQFCSGVSVYVTSTGEMIDCDITATSTTVMTFVFAVAPSANTLTFAIST